MPPVFQSSNTVDKQSASTSWAITKPSGLAVGDLMILQIVCMGSLPATITPPSGFTLVTSIENTTGSGTGGMAIYSKIADADDAAASSFTTTLSASRKGVGMLCRITGHRPVDYVGDYSSITSEIGIPSLDPIRENSLLMMFVGGFDRLSSGGNDSYAVANGSPTWTEIFDLNDADKDGGGAAAYADWTPSGATGNGSFNSTTFRPNSVAAIMLLVSAQFNFSVTVSESINLSESISTPKTKSANPIDTVNVTDEVEVDTRRVRNTPKNSSSWRNTPKSN